jgi:acyl dehydratase
MEQMTEPIIQGEAVSALIPQKPPIEMVDTLWFNDDTKTISGFTIPHDNIFCEEGLFREPGIIENIAQTAALRTGYMVSMLPGHSDGNPPVGYIGAIKKLRIHLLPKAGETLKTEVTIQQMIFDVTLIHGRSTVNGELVAECEMKIFLKKD